MLYQSITQVVDEYSFRRDIYSVLTLLLLWSAIIEEAKKEHA